MGQMNILSVEPRGNKSADEYMNYLANVLAMNQDEFLNLLEGRLSSINIREIAGFLVDLLTLKHKSGLVGMSAADPNNPDAVRIWAGHANLLQAPFRVLQNGKLFATDALITGRVEGSVIVGSEIKTSESTYPRAEMSSTNKLFAAYQSAENYVKLSPDAFGSTPGFTFHNGTGIDALIYLYNNIVQALSISTPAGAADISISSGKDLALSGTNVNAGGIWTFTQTIHGDITGKASYADNAGKAATADSLAPIGTISWFQVEKAGSSLAHLETKNLSDLTQSSSYRTATDTEKSTWNAKASTTYVDNGLATKANKTQEAYITVTPLNGWENFSPSFQPTAYYKDEFGVVHVTGFVKNGSIAYGTAIFTLPVGYRPSLIHMKNAVSQNSTSAIVSATLEVHPDGNVVVSNNVGSSWVVLDFSFRAEQ